MTSPHALAFDGGSIWVGGMSSHATIYQLNPADGSTLSTIFNIRSQGISIIESTLWCVEETEPYMEPHLVQYDLSGKRIQKFGLDDRGITDMTVIGDTFYYSVNDGLDRIVKVLLNPFEVNDLIENTVSSEAISTLANKNGLLYVVDNGGYSNREYYQLLKSFDPNTQELVGADTLKISGWITAIAPNLPD